MMQEQGQGYLFRRVDDFQDQLKRLEETLMKRLDAMDDARHKAVDETRSWQESHHRAHEETMSLLTGHMREDEGRLTSLESGASTTKALGGIGILISWALAALGIGQPLGKP